MSTSTRSRCVRHRSRHGSRGRSGAVLPAVPGCELAAWLLGALCCASLAGAGSANAATDAPQNQPGAEVFGSAGYVGSLTDHGYSEGFRLNIEPYGLALIVRTVNVCMGDADDCLTKALENRDPGWSTRLEGIAELMLADDPAQVGLIGLQEAGTKSLLGLEIGHKFYCEHLARETFAAECLAGALGAPLPEHQQPGGVDERTAGIVAGSPWSIGPTYSSHLQAGRPFKVARDQGVIGALLEHQSGLRLRFYSLKLEPGDEPVDHEVRLDQVQELIEVIRAQTEPGELPPIVVGDFNHYRDYHELGTCRYDGTVYSDADDDCVSDASVKLMEEYFWRPLDAGCGTIGEYNNIDMVYIARTPQFFGPPPCGRAPVVPTPAYDWLAPDGQGYFTFGEHRRLPMHRRVPRVARAYVRQRTESQGAPSRNGALGDTTVEVRLRVLFDQPMAPESFSAIDFSPQPDAIVTVDGRSNDGGHGTPNCKQDYVYLDGKTRPLCRDCYPNPDNPTHGDDHYDVCEFEIIVTWQEDALAEPSELVASTGPGCLRTATLGPFIASRQGYIMDQNRDGYANGGPEDAHAFCIESNPADDQQPQIESVQQIHAEQARLEQLIAPGYLPQPGTTTTTQAPPLPGSGFTR